MIYFLDEGVKVIKDENLGVICDIKPRLCLKEEYIGIFL